MEPSADSSRLKASPWTAIKENFFREWLQIYVAIANAVQTRHIHWAGRWFYFDLTSGPGLIDNGDADLLDGSPLIALKEFQAKTSFKVDCLFCEKNQSRATELSTSLDRLYSQWSEHDCNRIRYEVQPCDHRELLKHRTVTNSYGFLYWDGLGGDTYPAEDLRFWLEANPYHDLFVMASGTAPKRRGTPRVDQLLETVPRKYMWISEPNGKWQWIFALCTNWERLQQTGRRRLCRHDSFHGKEILNKLATTNGERKATQEKFQLSLFDR